VKIAFLGLGKMGMAVARRMRDSGADMIVWNRSAKSAADLAMKVAATPAEAVAGSDVVFTMLNDDELRQLIDGIDAGSIPLGAGDRSERLDTHKRETVFVNMKDGLISGGTLDHSRPPGAPPEGFEPGSGSGI